MRFTNGRDALKFRENETRVVKDVFLLWPRCFDRIETRWLEKADIVERVTKVDVGGSGEWGLYRYEWVEIAFANH